MSGARQIRDKAGNYIQVPEPGMDVPTHDTHSHEGVLGVPPPIVWTDSVSGNVFSIEFDSGNLFILCKDSEGETLSRFEFDETGTEIVGISDGEVQARVVVTRNGGVTIRAFNGVAELGLITINQDEGLTLAGPGYATQVTLTETMIQVLGAPSTDPEVEGALFTSGAPGPSDPKALMVSGGSS